MRCEWACIKTVSGRKAVAATVLLPSVPYSQFYSCSGLGYNLLDGTLPASIGNFTSLQSLYVAAARGGVRAPLAACAYHKITHTHTHTHSALLGACAWYRNLQANRLSGTVPATLTSLTGLVTLYAATMARTMRNVHSPMCMCVQVPARQCTYGVAAG